MPFSAGTRLGPYEILAPIGAGGMGEVYRAHDPRMGRDVAIKVAAERFSDRFSREVHAIAALNHPNICTLYDVGPNYLVMELVEGPTLAERIKEGAIPVDEALAIANQIADALEAAHEKGITHRDLKPGNVKIKPGGAVKVLDFGLAKVAPASASGPDSDDSATFPLTMTQPGVILGTPAYMSPEQVRGQAVDKRTDIWAFGVVLYEMLTGRRPFKGVDVAEILAAVISKQPSWEPVPVQAQRLLERCLEKDPHKRLRDITGVGLLLEETPVGGGLVRLGGGRARLLPWIAAGALAVIVVALAIMHFRQTPAPQPLMRFSADLGPEAVEGPSITAAISPDGTRLAFVARGPAGKRQLATRLLNQAKATLLSNTENAADPFFSPDGQWIGFFADQKLKKISVQGGPAVTLCDVSDPRGASWGQDGWIILNLTPNPWRRPFSGAGGGRDAANAHQARRQRRSYASLAADPARRPGGAFHRSYGLARF